MKTRCRVWGAAALVALAVDATPVARGEELSDKIDRLEGELQEMKHELQRQKDAQAQQAKEAEELRAKQVPAEPATVGAVADAGGVPMYRKVLDRVQIGGYGSTRFEASDLENQNNSFVLRRFVLTADANIAPRLRSYFELEFERFRKLEVEKQLQPASGGLEAEQEIEATNNSEIALEQAWVQYDVTDWLKFRGGGVLVPLGRFNLNHDDNRWDLPRRSLVDRGVPVLPTTAAWDEVGMGFVGDVTLSDQAVMNYQVYAVNGVVLNYNLEQVAQTSDSGQGKVGLRDRVGAVDRRIRPRCQGFESRRGARRDQPGAGTRNRRLLVLRPLHAGLSGERGSMGDRDRRADRVRAVRTRGRGDIHSLRGDATRGA